MFCLGCLLDNDKLDFVETDWNFWSKIIFVYDHLRFNFFNVFYTLLEINFAYFYFHKLNRISYTEAYAEQQKQNKKQGHTRIIILFLPSWHCLQNVTPNILQAYFHHYLYSFDLMKSKCFNDILWAIHEEEKALNNWQL